jgi:hypothetical protein
VFVLTKCTGRKQLTRGLGGTLSSLRQEIRLKSNIFDLQIVFAFWGLQLISCYFSQELHRKDKRKNKWKTIHRRLRKQLHKMYCPHFLINVKSPFLILVKKQREIYTTSSGDLDSCIYFCPNTFHEPI